MNRPHSPEITWKQKMVRDYYDYRWTQLLEPLYRDFRLWKARKRTHAEMDQSLQAAHKQSQYLYQLFAQGHETLAEWIQMDHEWFDPWLAENPAPSGIQLLPRTPG